MTRSVSMTQQRQQYCRYALILLVIVLPHVSSWSNSGGLSNSNNNRNKWNLEATLQKARTRARTWIATASVGAALATSVVCPAGAFADGTVLAMPPHTETQSEVVQTKAVEGASNAETKHLEQQVQSKALMASSTETYQTETQGQSDPKVKSQPDETESTEQEDWKPVFRSIDTPQGSKVEREEESKLPFASTEITQHQKQDGTESKAPFTSTDTAQTGKRVEKPLDDDSIETEEEEEEEEESSTKSKIESSEEDNEEEGHEEKSLNKSDETRIDKIHESKPMFHSTEATKDIEKEDNAKELTDSTKSAQARTQVESRSPVKEIERPEVEKQEESQAKVESTETSKFGKEDTETQSRLTEETKTEKQSEALESSIDSTRASHGDENDKPSTSPPAQAEKSKAQVESTETTKDEKPSKRLVCSIEGNEIHCYFY